MTRPRDRIDDALDGLTARELQDIVRRAELRLRSCVMCGEPGAESLAVSRGSARATMSICPACFERYRRPEPRARE